MVADVLPSFMGFPLKWISLATLTVQNSALILIMHYSRIMPTTSPNRYFASTAVFLNEIIKLVLCFGVAYRNRRKVDGSMTLPSTTIKNILVDIFRADSWKLAIPACLYTLQNTLQYVAVSELDAATFQVTYQLKILTTAIFSVTLLRRRLSLMKWISLVILTSGVAIVQLPTNSTDASNAGSARSEPGTNRFRGITVVIFACMISGLAGVYFEKVLKGSNTSLWIRNIQLSVWSVPPALFIGVIFRDGKEILERGFFDGYNMVVWTAIIFQSFGGIVVALCVNYADNIAKNFATSISILISCVVSVFFFDFIVTTNFVIGACVVLLATWMYSRPDSSNSQAVQYTPLGDTELDLEKSNTNETEGK